MSAVVYKPSKFASDGPTFEHNFTNVSAHEEKYSSVEFTIKLNKLLSSS